MISCCECFSAIRFHIIVNFQGDNSVFSFGFADSTATVPFAIDPSTGVITVSGSLNYETTQQYSFMVGLAAGYCYYNTRMKMIH